MLKLHNTSSKTMMVPSLRSKNHESLYETRGDPCKSKDNIIV